MALPGTPVRRALAAAALALALAPAAAAQPAIDVAPDSVAAALGANGTAARALVVTNPGDAPLHFALPDFGGGAAARSDAPVLELAKGAPDPRVGRAARGGGSDGSGYTWLDSDDPEGPDFAWVDVVAPANRLPLGDDDFEDVPLPFAFPFYGQSYTSVRVTSNGFLTFSTGPGATSYTNQPVPRANVPNAFIAPYWDDLDPSQGGAVYAGVDARGRFVVLYDRVRTLGGGTAGTYTMEVILDPSGVILFQYLDVVGPGLYGTVGIENGGGTDGLEIAFNAAYVRDGLAVRIASRPVWLAVSPSAGTVAPGDSAEVAVSISSAGLLAGAYAYDLTLTSDAPATPVLTVPVSLAVAAEPDVAVTPDTLAFGGLFDGGTAVRPLTVTNTGTSPLVVASVSVDGGAFAGALPAPATLAPGQRVSVDVTFAPTSVGPQAGTLTVASDDPDRPFALVALTGEGLPAPDVALGADSVAAALFTNESTTQTLAVGNTGGAPLDFTVALRSGPGLDGLRVRPAGPAPDGPLAVAAARAPRAMTAGGGAFMPLSDSLYYDRGGPSPDGYYGWGGSAPTPFIVANRFTTTSAFALTAVRVALRTGAAASPVTVEVFAPDTLGQPTSGALLRSVTVDLATGQGALVEIPLGTALPFAAGQEFYVVVATQTGGNPMGADQIQGDRSYYFHNWFGEWRDSFATWTVRALSGTGGWLEASPITGTVPPGGSLDVALDFDATGLFGGTYRQTLVVQSNDPDAPSVSVPVRLDVTGVPDVVVAPAALDFGDVYVGGAAVRSLTLANAGTDVLTVSALASASPDVTAAADLPATLGPGDTLVVAVTYAPASAGPLAAPLTVVSDDPDEAAVAVALTGAALDAPDVAVTPDSLAAALLTGATTTLALTVSNQGAGPLTYAFDGFGPAGRSAAAPARPAPPDVAPGKDAPDPRPPAARGSGGPDAFGYRWTDSDEPGGPTFAWTDIRAAGTLLQLFDDFSVDVDLPFTFPFYDSTYTRVRVTANGYLTFGGGGLTSEYRNDPIPAAYAPNGLVAAFWDDLNPGAGGTVHHLATTDRFVVQYTDVERYGDAASHVTFQAVLHADGRIEYLFHTMEGETGSATVGIEDGTGTDGLQVAYNTGYVHDSLAVRIATTPPWLAAVTPAAGTLAPGASVEVAVALDAAGLQGGRYAGTLLLVSDDPDEGALPVPVTLDVTGVPDVAVTPAQLAFGAVAAPGGTAVRAVTVANAGTDVLTVSGVASDAPAFAAEPAGPFTLAAGQSRTVTVTFAPPAFGAYAGTLSVASDDPDEPLVAVALSGDGTAAPDVAATPDSLFAELDADSSAVRTLTLTNSGEGPLEFSVLGLGAAARAAAGAPRPDRPDPATPQPALAKGAPDPRTGEASAMGGPDAFGYRWADSNEPGGPAFAWVDVSATAAELPLSDDAFAVVTLPFAFPFYGQSHTEAVVSSNGFLSFGTGGASTFTNAPIPRTTTPNELIAPYWDDLNPGAGGAVYAGADSLGRFVVQWAGVPRYGTNDRYTFEVVLDSTGAVLFQYLAMEGPLLALGTVGIEDKLGTDGLEVAFNAPYVHDGLAVRFASTPPWLTDVAPASGTVAPGGSVELAVTFDAAGLESGRHEDVVRIQTNDPDEALLTVPATLDVTGDVLLALRAGWNLVSWSVDVADAAPAAVLAPVLERVLAVESLRGGERRTWAPGRPPSENTLTAMEPTYSYWVRMSAPATLAVRGAPVAAQTPLALGAGANAVAYLPTRAAGIGHALGGVAEATLAASAFPGTGLTYAPAVPEAFHVLAQMEPKAGYVLHLTTPATLVYPAAAGGGGVAPDEPSVRPTLEGRLRTEREAGVVPTPRWVSVWGDKVGFPDGTELPVGLRVTAVDPDGTVCGAFDVVAEGNVGLMAVYADDPDTPQDEGAEPGDAITLRFGTAALPAALTWTGFGAVVDLSHVVVAGEGGPEDLPAAFALEGSAPNPFREAATVRYALPEAARVRLVVYDLLGRAVATLVDADVAAGRHAVVWDAAGAASGAYVLMFEAGDFRASHRLTLVR